MLILREILQQSLIDWLRTRENSVWNRNYTCTRRVEEGEGGDNHHHTGLASVESRDFRRTAYSHETFCKQPNNCLCSCVIIQSNVQVDKPFFFFCLYIQRPDRQTDFVAAYHAIFYFLSSSKFSINHWPRFIFENHHHLNCLLNFFFSFYLKIEW